MAQTWTTPNTKAAGDLGLSTDWNTYVRDNTSYLRNVIGETVLSATATAITFSSIPSNYRHLYLVLMGRGDVAAINVGVVVTFNGDSGANYYSEDVEAVNATVTAAGGAGTNGFSNLALPAASATVGRAGVATLLIPNHAQTTFHKVCFMGNYYGTSTTAATQRARFAGATWANTAAITSITLTAASSNFIAGTYATLYGLYV